MEVKFVRLSSEEIEVLSDGEHLGYLYKFPHEGMTEWAACGLLEEGFGMNVVAARTIREAKQQLASAAKQGD